MNTNRRHAVAALIAAGLLWGTTVPLSKLALEWLSPGWLTAVRFGLAAAVLLAAARRRGLRRAFTPAVLAAGALGYGGSVLLQNAGISRTSVTHAALLIGAVPVLVAIIAAVWHRTVARPVAWSGFALSLGGVGLVTAGGGSGGATSAGDGLVLASLILSATVTVAQGRLLIGRDPVAVTAVQFLGAALGALPVAVLTEGAPAVPGSAGPVLAVVALTAGGTLLPFTLFAFGQSRVSAEVAGAFLNLEPLVGAIAGAVAFGDPVGSAQVGGGAAIVAGIGLSSVPLLTSRRTAPRQTAPPAPHHAGCDQTVRPARPPRYPPRCRVARRGFHHSFPGGAASSRHKVSVSLHPSRWGQIKPSGWGHMVRHGICFRAFRPPAVPESSGEGQGASRYGLGDPADALSRPASASAAGRLKAVGHHGQLRGYASPR